MLKAIATADNFMKLAFIGFLPSNYMRDRLFGPLSLSSGIAVTAARRAILMPIAGASNDAARMPYRSTGTAHDAAPTLTH
jgi:hypothetical protein